MFKYFIYVCFIPLSLLALNAPSDIQTTALSKTSITLSWQDNSADEIGFKIFRDGKFLILTAPNTTDFTDENLTPHTTYTYLIYATDDVQDEVITDKTIYTPNENIIVNFRHLSEPDEWIGIYPIDSPDDDIESARWHHIENKTYGDVTYGRFAVGTYEVRSFTEESVLKATYAFTVKEAPAEKKLILAQGQAWLPSMTENFIDNHNNIMQLPFDGYAVVGNQYTNIIMSNQNLNYETIKNEVEGLTNLYVGRDMFLTVKVKFPGDFWDAVVWDKVISNFGIIARVAKEIGFKGIIFDDEADDTHTKQMTNFKFPTIAEVEANPDDYAQWLKDGAYYTGNATMDENAYRNIQKTFEEHMQKVISLYEDIMQEMVLNYDDIDVLVYHGPVIGHHNTFNINLHKGHQIINGQGLARSHEYVGAIFTGLKRGVSATASIHDMGEMYKYRTDEHFARAYQWRKFNMTKDVNNDSLDPTYQWQIPTADRATWRDEVNLGHMVFSGQEADSNYPEYDPSNVTFIGNTKTNLKLALESADEYAIYYTHDQEWLMPGYNGHEFIGSEWVNTVREVNP